jgi:predicted ATPase/class 3 adenylate cyclase
MADLPAGTVTFVFTDLEGSTRLLQAHPDAYRDAVARHHALLRGAVEAHGGVVFETVGDAVYAAFARPTDAVKAALAGQLALQAEDWGGVGALRARMGLHLGEVERQGGHYFGAPLYRCARLTATAHGGQAVLPEATAALVRDALPPGAGLRDLGAHRLKDLAAPERIYQLVASALPADFPPLRTLDALPNNLPVQLTSFVGRERALAEVGCLLAAERLVTLTGAGGVGKTRLALRVAADGLDRFPDGVWLVDLAPLADEALVPQAVAAAVGVREDPGRPLVATLADALRPKRLLLVLDNCEHLLEACARLAEGLLRACPDLRVLATSREALGLAGEAPYRVPSLALPAAPGPLSVEALAPSEAVRLFAARAATVRPGFAVTAQNAAAVAEVCRRLDGIPLALELAAARVRVLPVEPLLARLEDRFRLLTGGSRTALARHQTLRAAVDWSYDLLGAAERTLFARLSGFAGGFTLEAAEAVGAGEGIEPVDVLDLLTRLVDKSLVVAEEQPDGAARYRLLETLRQYAQETPAAHGGAEAVRARHAAYYLALAERAAPELEGPRQRAWLDRLEAELDNLRQALRWSQAEGGRAEAGLRLATALGHLWRLRGHQREGREWLEAALALPAAAPRTAARAAALDGAGVLAWILGDGAAAGARLEASVALWRALGDGRGLGRALANLGLAALDRDRAAARPVLEEAVARARAAGDRWGLALALRFLGTLEGRGPPAPGGSGGAPARPSPLEESATLFRELGDPWGLGEALAGLDGRAFRRGDYPAARAHFEEALALRRALGNARSVAVDLIDLTIVARARGDLRGAAARGEEGRALAQAVGATPLVAEALAHLGHVALAGGDAGRAAALLGESLRLVRAHGLEADTWRLARGLAGLAGGGAAGARRAPGRRRRGPGRGRRLAALRARPDDTRRRSGPRPTGPGRRGASGVGRGPGHAPGVGRRVCPGGGPRWVTPPDCPRAR